MAEVTSTWFRKTLKRGLLVVAGLCAIFAFAWFVGALDEVCRWRASAAIAQRDEDRALRWLSYADRIAPHHPHTEFLIARAYRKLADVDQFQNHLRQAVQDGLSRDTAQREELLAEAQTGRIHDTSQIAALFVNPGQDGAEICEALVNGCLLNYRFNDARPVLDAWEKDYPADSQPHFIRGRILEHINDWTASEKEFRKALALQPDHPGANYDLACLLLTQNKFDAALEHFRAASSPAHPNVAAEVKMRNACDFHAIQKKPERS